MECLFDHSTTPAFQFHLEVMVQDGFDAADNFFAVVGPNALTPIPETTGLGTEQVK